MEDIFTLLKLNKGLIEDFSLKANNLVDHQTELLVKRNVRILEEVEGRMLQDYPVKYSSQSIEEVIEKVIDNAKANNRVFSIWSIRELRIVSYYLMKLPDNDFYYRYALSLLDNNWRDLFLNGLSFYCLETWSMMTPQKRSYTCEFLRGKLEGYNGVNKRYMVMKNHLNLFDEAGPLRLSAMIFQNNLDLKDAPSLLGNKPYTLNQSYYSDVILNYCNVNRITDLDLIESILEVHNLERTKKLLLADLVDRFNEDGDEIKRTMLCSFINRILGDVTLGVTWAPFYGASEEDVLKLRRAKELVNLWFNKKIIETFFEVCVQDRLRKDFWLDYVKYLSGFRIVGSSITKRMLQSDPRIDKLHLKYFIKVDQASSKTSALILFIKNKMLVEFSDTGALYVYNNDHNMVNTVLRKHTRISSIRDLKITTMDNLITKVYSGYYDFEDQGRMVHSGGWQSRLKEWMDDKVFSSSSSSHDEISSFENDDDKIFIANPIVKEEPQQSDIYEADPETGKSDLGEREPILKSIQKFFGHALSSMSRYKTD